MKPEIADDIETLVSFAHAALAFLAWDQKDQKIVEAASRIEAYLATYRDNDV